MAKKKSKFQTVVEATPEISNCYQIGLQALGKYSNKIEVKDKTKICGSVELDKCVESKYPSENRWDYIICYDEVIYFVEIHSADTGEVSTIIKKLQWLKNWLIQNGTEISKLRHKTQPYIWIQSGKYDILKGSSQDRQLAQLGLRPISKLKLPIQ